MDNENKQINIVGINNRYHMKKLIQAKKISERKNSLEIKSITCFENHELQKKILLDSSLHEKEYSFILSELKRKISSYKQQDITKNKYNERDFISIDYVIQLLKVS